MSLFVLLGMLVLGIATDADTSNTSCIATTSQIRNDLYLELKEELRNELRKECQEDMNMLKERMHRDLTEIDRRQSGTYAFTAYLDHVEHVHPGNFLKFNRILYNAGNMFNPFTGVVTIVKSGTYLFSMTIEHWQTAELVCTLMVDGEDMVDVVLAPSGRSQMSSNTAILGLGAGQSVWVQTTEGTLFGDAKQNNHLTTFSGVLLY